MRILFFVHTPGRTRHFQNVIRGLIERSHTVVLVTGHGVEPHKLKRGLYDHPLIEVVSCPTLRADRWASVVDPLRRARDSLRFLDPRYAHAVKLAARAREHAPPGWNRAIHRNGWLKRNWRLVQRALALAEAVTPCDPAFRRFMQAQSADLALVTPLVDFGSYQTDHVKCAHQLAAPRFYSRGCAILCHPNSKVPPACWPEHCGDSRLPPICSGPERSSERSRASITSPMPRVSSRPSSRS